MSWSKRLAYKLDLTPRPEPMAGFSGPGADERIRNTLARNPAIGGDLGIVNEILAVGEVVGFHQGEAIIEQDANGDDVIFLLAGEADIIVNGRKRTFRSAPNQVGEMAVLEPGKSRSATVRVRSTTACGIRISGTEFRTVWESHANFKGRLQVEMASRHREWLAATQVTMENTSLLWSALSTGAAVVAAAISWFYFNSSEWPLSVRLAASGGVSIGTFLVFLLRNPAFFWRRCFHVLLLVLVGKLFWDASVTIEVIQEFDNLQFFFLSSGTEVGFSASMVNSILLAALMGMCMWKDHLELRK